MIYAEAIYNSQEDLMTIRIEKGFSLDVGMTKHEAIAFITEQIEEFLYGEK